MKTLIPVYNVCVSDVCEYINIYVYECVGSVYVGIYINIYVILNTLLCESECMVMHMWYIVMCQCILTDIVCLLRYTIKTKVQHLLYTPCIVVVITPPLIILPQQVHRCVTPSNVQSSIEMHFTEHHHQISDKCI